MIAGTTPSQQDAAPGILLRYSAWKVFSIGGFCAALLFFCCWLLLDKFAHGDRPAVLLCFALLILPGMVFFVRDMLPAARELLVGKGDAVALDQAGRLILPANGVVAAPGEVLDVEYLKASLGLPHTVRFTLRIRSRPRKVSVNLRFLRGSAASNLDLLKAAFASDHSSAAANT